MGFGSAIAAGGAPIGQGWLWLFSGVHGAIVEAAIAVAATSVITDMMAQDAEQLYYRNKKERLKKEAEEEGKEWEDEEEEDDRPRCCGYDTMRMCRMNIIGGIYGPSELLYFYLISTVAGWPWWGQTIFDNLVFTPTVSVIGIVLNKVMRDYDEEEGLCMAFDGTCEELGPKLFDMLKICLPYWIVGDGIMFTVIPLRHRVLFSRIWGFPYVVWCQHVMNDPEYEENQLKILKAKKAERKRLRLLEQQGLQDPSAVPAEGEEKGEGE